MPYNRLTCFVVGVVTG
jgi:hypothetical protein